MYPSGEHGLLGIGAGNSEGSPCGGGLASVWDFIGRGLDRVGSAVEQQLFRLVAFNLFISNPALR